MGNTLAINRIELKKDLAMLGVSSRNIEAMEAALNKRHRHVNAVAFAGMLQKAGLRNGDIKTIFRKIGIDDIAITNTLNLLDEDKIADTFGKVVELSIG